MACLNRSPAAARWLALACWFTAFGLGECNYVHEHERYLRRSDTITLGAGDAVAHNNAVQTINPWPYWSRNDRINMEGNRAALAIKRYQENKSIPPQTLDTSSISIGGGSFGSGGGSQ
jgi:uncharacterized membrane protein YgcG